MRLAKHFDTTFNVVENTPTTGSMGELIPATTPVSTGNKGKLDMLTGNKQLVNERMEVIANYLLICGNITISPSHIVVIAGGDYDVIRVDNTLLRGRNPHLEVYLFKQ